MTWPFCFSFQYSHRQSTSLAKSASREWLAAGQFDVAGRGIPRSTAARHIQLVLADRSNLTEGRNFGVVSPQIWRLADLGAKHAFLRAGLGWGIMPQPMVDDDIARGALVRIELEAHPSVGPAFSMHAIYSKDAPPGPAGRWFVSQLKRW